MQDEIRVYVATRAGRKRVTYHCRWVDPCTGRWKWKKSGTDIKRAQRDAAVLEKSLNEGSYTDVKRIPWVAFVDEHVGKITGTLNAKDARRTLDDFGKACSVREPRGVDYAALESYLQHLKDKGNSVPTRNKRFRYLRAAFKKAVRRGYLARNPMDGWSFEREDRKPPRIIAEVESDALLKSADELYGLQWWAMIYVALNTGGRRSELTSLTWERVDLDPPNPRIHFTQTKGKRDRFIPITPEIVDALRRLKAKTLRDGGPFVTLTDNREWCAIREAACVPDVTLHDCRRTYATRLIRAGVELPTVQKLCGHSVIQTTLTYYNWTSDADLRAGVERLRKASIG